MTAKILIADDEPHIRRVVELKLQSAGFDVRPVSNAEEALRVAREYLPNLVVTDYKMTGAMNGVDLIRALRETPGVTKTPIILLTGSVAVLHDLDIALKDVPHVELLSKPFSPRMLLKRVQDILADGLP